MENLVKSHLRRVAEDLPSNETSSVDWDDWSDGMGEDVFDPKVFYSVVSSIMVMLCIVCLWCCYGDKSFLTQSHQRRIEADAQYQAQVLRRDEERKARKVETPEKRRRNLLQSFRRHNVQMTVRTDDLIDEDAAITEVGSSDASTSGEESIKSVEDDVSLASSLTMQGHLRLPTKQVVPNCCAICLCNYDVGDEVVWSSNEQCGHAFHIECICDWLIKMQPETPCPCCRQEFTDLETVRKERKIIWTGDTFNLRTLSL